jgi:hypothetical protein
MTTKKSKSILFRLSDRFLGYLHSQYHIEPLGHEFSNLDQKLRAILTQNICNIMQYSNKNQL